MKNIWIFLTIFAYSCDSDHQREFYQIAGENWEVFMDTMANRYGTFFPSPQDLPLKDSANKNLAVQVDTLVHFDSTLSRELAGIARGRMDGKFEDVLNEEPIVFSGLELNKIDHNKKIKLLPIGSINTGIGKVSFLNSYIKDKKAILCIEKTDNTKGGLVKAFFLARENGHWKVVDKYDLRIY
ncbi:MAG: hypothetical protein ACO1OO_01300 [Flavisolibacter sp.]